jgi:hypothetical protein
MTQFIPFSRDQAFLLPPDAKDWLPADNVAHFVVAAVDRVPLGAFAMRPVPGGKAQYHPRVRTAGPPQLPLPGRGPDGGVRLHRGLLQSDQAPLSPGLPLAHRIRSQSHGRERLIPIRKPSTEAGQLQLQKRLIPTANRARKHGSGATSPAKSRRRLPISARVIFPAARPLRYASSAEALSLRPCRCKARKPCPPIAIAP